MLNIINKKIALAILFVDFEVLFLDILEWLNGRKKAG
jgi:hypothetical protein